MPASVCTPASLPRVLVLSSRRAAADVLAGSLGATPAEVYTAESVAHATELLLDNDFDVVVLHPDASDPELRQFARRLDRLRSRPATVVVGAGASVTRDAADGAPPPSALDGTLLQSELLRVLSKPALREPRPTLRQMEEDAIAAAFSEARGNVSQAAKRLGIPRSTLRDRLRRLGMR